MAHPAGTNAYHCKQCLPCHAQEAGIVGCRFHLRRGQKTWGYRLVEHRVEAHMQQGGLQPVSVGLRLARRIRLDPR